VLSVRERKEECKKVDFCTGQIEECLSGQQQEIELLELPLEEMSVE
jgi:hypothetical protein